MLQEILSNPVVISVVVMCVLCLIRFNVLLALFASALLAGILSDKQILETTDTLINGMSGNLKIALSYILLGCLAAAIAKSKIIKFLIYQATIHLFKGKILLCFFIAFIACLSQNLIPVHIAFIPILIPPLLTVINTLNLDRRAIACALTFGLQAPYIALPVGYGLIFHQVIIEQMNQNGFNITFNDTANVLWIGSFAMFIGLVIAILVFCAKPREYKQTFITTTEQEMAQITFGLADFSVIFGAIVAFGTQIWTQSMPLGAFIGIVIMLLGKGIVWNSIDSLMDEGIRIMGFVAFVMLVAAGFGEVLKSSGAVENLVDISTKIIDGKIGGAILMLLIGLLITIGIGTSFGTIPIIATFYCPLCIQLGFSIESTILLIGIAGALGDAGSPASDSTIGPTSGLNADSQHNHIWDTCVPTFFAFNVPLMLAGIIGVMIFG